MLLAGAALAMVLRAPVYLTAPSFWAEEGTLYFAVAWEHPLREALTYRPAGYLLLWANLATTLAARLVRAGLLPLAHAPHVTVLFALAAQLVPVAVIAWSRAPFWGGTPRRAVGIAILLFAVLTDEIWLNTINSQPWLVMAAVLLLLEPAASGWRRSWAAAGVVALAGLSAPVASILAPLYAWRAWRTRARPAVAQAMVLVACLLVQAWCVLASAESGPALAARAEGLSLGTFAAVVWMRALVLPLLGIAASQDVGLLVARSGGVGAGAGTLFLVLAAGLLGWLACGLRAAERLPLTAGYVLVTTFTILSTVGGKALLLHSPWASSRYFYAPGTIVLLMVLGCVRRGAGWLRPVLGVLVLAVAIGAGIVHYGDSLRWKPDWPRWPDEVAAWSADPRRPLRIWPPRWTVTLRPIDSSAATVP